MKRLLLALQICFLARFANSQALTDAEYVKMPQLFYLDDFDRCMMLGEEALFCSITFQLAPVDSLKPSETWRILEKSKQIRRYYRHDNLRHGICVPTSCPNISKEIYYVGDHDEELERALSACYSDKYRELGLKGRVIEMHCENHEPFYKVDAVDKFVGCALFALFALVIYGSFYEGLARYKSEEEYIKITSTTFGKIMSCFSVPKNFYRLRIQNTTEDALQLRSIQGMRFFTMFCIVMAHVCMLNLMMPMSNPKFNEDSTLYLPYMFVANGGYAVQTFFSISGLLTSYLFFKTFEGKQRVPIRHLVMAIVNRYIRLTPVLLVMVAVDATWLVHVNRGPVWDSMVGYEYRNCRGNWWTNLLYLNNYIDKENMCLQQTWYIAADTQVFIAAIVVSYLMFVYREHVKSIIIASISISILIPFTVNYYNGFDILTRHYPEELYTTLRKTYQWHIMFSAGYNNMGGYMVGIAFGYVFYLYRKSNMFTRKIYVWIWWFVIFAFPLSVVYVAGIFYMDGFHATRFWSAAYVSCARPFFALGIMLSILGMAQGQGWYMRWLLEWAPVQILGRISYCAYLVHVSLQRVRMGELRRPVYSNTSQYLFQTFGDVGAAFIAGTLLCLFVEMPVSALQKLLIPEGKVRKEVPEKNGTNKGLQNGFDKKDK